MKNVILYSVPLMIAGTLLCSTANAERISAPGNKAASELINSLKAKKRTAPRANVVGFKNATSGLERAAAGTPIAQMEGELVNFLSDDEGNVWYYTMKTNYRDDSYGAAISNAKIEVFNNKHESAGVIDINIPDDMMVNAITPYGTITKKFFDLDDKNQELLVELHQVGNAENNYQGKYYTYVYHLDGTKATEFEGAGVFLNIVKNAWTKYQRFVLTNAKFEAVDGKTYEDGSPYMTTMDHIDIYKPASYGSSEPSLEKSFLVDEDLTYYGNDGVPVTIYNIDGEPYYVLSHYSKIFSTSEIDPETGFSKPVKDNSVIIKTYDKYYNLVDDINIPMPPAEDTEYRMAQIGNFANWSVSKNLFTNDGKLSYVLTYYDMTTKVDDFRYSFVAYDHEGKKIGDICTGVYKTWFKLNSINGQEEQMAFMQYVDDDESQQQIRIVNLPTFTEYKDMPAFIDGNLISTVFNRYGNADGYKYLMKISQGDVDAEGNVIAKVAWLNPDLEVDHYTRFNLGPQAENFALTLSDTYINPYLFNTNDKMEFFFQAKVKEEGSSKIDNVYMVGDEDGNILHKFANNEKGRISSMGCFPASNDANEMYVAYSNDNNSNYKFEFYKLPLTKFEKGGDGTAANPYLVASAGDLMFMKNEPNASYKLANDIDMDNFAKTSSTWVPIANFGGKFDGDNHNISNLHLATDKASVGLFGDLANNAEVKNLVFVNPSIELTDNNSTVGVVAASSIKGAVKNVHVFGAEIKGEAGATIGGVIGQGSLETTVSEVSVNNAEIDAPNASSVGSIAGDIRTSTVIEAAAANNVKINAANSVGGIVGAAMQSTVKNSRANGEFKAENVIGGIIGSNGSTVTETCLFDGKVTATMSGWRKYSAAGIVGSLEPDWSGSTAALVKNNIVKGEINVEESADGDDYGYGEETEDNTVHRIVGRTIADEYYEEGETPQKEQRLANNWAVNTTTVKGATVVSSDETSVEGYDANESDINKDALAQIGFGFGTTAEKPWKESGETFPVLFFENETKAVVLSDNSLVMDVDDTAELSVEVYGSDNTDVTVTSSNTSVVEVASTSKDSEGKTTIKLKSKAGGEADINITSGSMTVTCKVSVDATSSIAAAASDKVRMNIIPGNGAIRAEGATSISVYAINGSNVANAKGSTVATAQMGKGVFIVVATDAEGNKQKAKVVIR